MTDEFEITTKEQLINVMKSSKNEQEWNDNYDRIKRSAAFKYWWETIMMSGIAHQIQQGWARSGDQWAEETSHNLFGDNNQSGIHTIHLKPPTPDEIEKWMNK